MFLRVSPEIRILDMFPPAFPLLLPNLRVYLSRKSLNFRTRRICRTDIVPFPSKTDNFLRQTRDENIPATGRDSPFSGIGDNALNDRSTSRSRNGRSFGLKELLRDPFERWNIRFTKVCVAGGRRSGGGSGIIVGERDEDREVVRGERG